MEGTVDTNEHFNLIKLDRRNLDNLIFRFRKFRIMYEEKYEKFFKCTIVMS